MSTHEKFLERIGSHYFIRFSFNSAVLCACTDGCQYNPKLQIHINGGIVRVEACKHVNAMYISYYIDECYQYIHAFELGFPYDLKETDVFLRIESDGSLRAISEDDSGLLDSLDKLKLLSDLGSLYE